MLWRGRLTPRVSTAAPPLRTSSPADGEWVSFGSVTSAMMSRLFARVFCLGITINYCFSLGLVRWKMRERKVSYLS